MKINTEIIRKLSPCKERFNVYLKHYAEFDGSMVDFLELDKITAEDKIWVSVRVLPRFLVEVFAIDCAFAAAGYADAAAADSAAYVAVVAADTATHAYSAGAYAAYAAAYARATARAAADDDAAAAAARAAEGQNQVDALIMLVKEEK